MKKSLLTLTVIFVTCLFAKATTYTVNSTLTTNTSTGATSGTLLWCINQVNATAGTHTIVFDNSMDGQWFSGFKGTALTRANTTIDGSTMSTYTCGNPRVYLDMDAFNGWQITGSGCIFRGLRIAGGLGLNGTGAHGVYGCVFNLGFDNTTVFASAAEAAIKFDVATTVNCIVGGFNDCDRNRIAGVAGNGVLFETSGNGHQILGNYIGSYDGLVGIGAGFEIAAVWIDGSGSSLLFDGNTIGNMLTSSLGAFLIQAGTDHIIRNNNIGANRNRLFVPSMMLRENKALFFDAGAGNNTVVTNNVMGNCPEIVSAGIAGTVVTVEGADNVSFINNYIGVDIGFNAGGSSWAGLYFYTGCISGTVTGNIIGFNGHTSSQRSHGLALFGNSGTFNISGNYIGVGPAGQDIGNGDAGIELNTNAAGTIFNITGNYIGFNRCLRFTNPGTLTSDGGGIRIISGQTVNITNNYIGTLPGAQLDCGNYRAGIGVEGVTAGQITITNNTIAYNKTNGIHTYKDSPTKVAIRQNCIMCNAWEGIELTGDAIGNASFGRSFATTSDGTRTVRISPQGGYATWESNLSGATWILRGWAPAGSSVDIFQNHHCNCNTSTAHSGTGAVRGGQGLDYIATVTADAGSRWTYSLPQNTVKNGFTVTATTTAAPIHTSEFSPCYASPITCLPPLTVTASGSGTGASGAVSGTSIAPCSGSTFTTTGSATFVRTSCYQNTYYTWYQGGTIVYGPSLTYIDYVKTNAVNPSDDGSYTLRVEDGNTGSASCYTTSNAVAVDVVSCAAPVEFLSFYGYNTNASNQLFWNTGIEINNNYFEIERSTDNLNFEAIGKVSPKGSQGAYSFEDNEFENGITNYYRIKQVDINGNVDYSTIIALSSASLLEFTLFPNPTNGSELNVAFTSKSGVKHNYSITDICGKEVLNGQFISQPGKNNESVNIEALALGVYLFSFQEESGKGNITKLIIEK